MTESPNQPSSTATAAAASTDGTTDELKPGLKLRHLTMMGLGSAIGAGLFLGTGVGIKAAGPAVLISYLIATFIVVMVMRILGELSAASPSSGSFASYAAEAFGPRIGFTTGWLYWFMLIMVLGAEMTAAGAIMGNWWGVEPWIPALVAVLFFTVVNFAAVRGFGEFEFWFAFIKVAVIVAFLIIGALLVFGLLPGTEFVGTTHIEESGFFPNGFEGVAAGLLAVAFAFGGIEIVTIAAAESEDPTRSISAAVRSVIFRITVFYLGSVLLIILLLPYATIDGANAAADSPFTKVLELANIPGAVMFMEVVIVLALLSAFNAQIYATSRLVYSMAHRGEAPRIFGKLNRNNVPQTAVVLSVVMAFGTVGLQMWNPANLMEFLLNAVGGCLLVIWFLIAASQLRLRPRYEAAGEMPIKVGAFPYTTWLTLALIAGLTLLMLFDDSARQQVIAVAVVVIVLYVLALIFLRPNAKPTAPQPE